MFVAGVKWVLVGFFKKESLFVDLQMMDIWTTCDIKRCNRVEREKMD